MLVIISDLHLADGSSGGTVSGDAFRILQRQLCNLARAASFRSDRGYRPIEELHLVLLGDVVDVIRSREWLVGDVRPWSDVTSPAFVGKIDTITKAVLNTNAGLVNVLKSISSGGIRIPATYSGHASVSADAGDGAERQVPVRVHTYYQVGNHDWFYHLRGAAFDNIRMQLVGAMGLANDPAQPFPHDANECPALAAVYRAHGVCARHGDIYDPVNYEHDRNASSLGDAIVVELLNRFLAEVTVGMGKILPQACLDGLGDIDTIQPLSLIPVWVDSLLERTCTDAEQIREVKRIWNDVVDRFLATPFVQNRACWWNPFNRVNWLSGMLKFSKGLSLRGLSKLALRVHERIEVPSHQDALREQAYRNREARYIVYGHTHSHKIVPLDYSPSRRGAIARLYINTGTWRHVHELAQGRPEKQEFVDYNVMTYTIFFLEDERWGRPFEIWSGALAPEP